MSVLKLGVFGILVFGAGFAGAVWAQPYLARPSLIDSGDGAITLCGGGGFRLGVTAAYSPRLLVNCKDENAEALAVNGGASSCCFVIRGVDFSGPAGRDRR